MYNLSPFLSIFVFFFFCVVSFYFPKSQIIVKKILAPTTDIPPNFSLQNCSIVVCAFSFLYTMTYTPSLYAFPHNVVYRMTFSLNSHKVHTNFHILDFISSYIPHLSISHFLIPLFQTSLFDLNVAKKNQTDTKNRYIK